MGKGLSILILLIIGIAYSIYLSFEGGIFICFIFIMITIGITATIYILDKKIDYRIIIYIWIAIVAISVASFICIGLFRAQEIFKDPLKFL